MRILFLLVVVCGLAPVVPARAAMHDALVAAEMLVDLAEARVVRLHLRDEAAAAAPIYGVVYQFEHLSWLYTPELGNRVLGPAVSEWLGREWLLAALRQVGVAVNGIDIYPLRTRRTYVPGQESLPNACVIGALAVLQDRLLSDPPVREAALVLLSYRRTDAAEAAALVVDHCVLAFRDNERWRCIDPRAPQSVIALDTLEIGAPVDPKLMAIALSGRYPLKSARVLAIAPSTLAQITRSALWRSWRQAQEVPE